MADNDLLTVPHAAAALARMDGRPKPYHRNLILRYIRQGRLPALRLTPTRRWGIVRADLIRFAAQARRRGRPTTKGE